MKSTFLLIAITLIFISCEEKGGTEADPVDIDTTEENKADDNENQLQESYSNQLYNVNLKYPTGWKVFESGHPFSIINIYSSRNESRLDLPLDIHSPADASYLGIFPEGFGTELPAGKQKQFTVINPDLDLKFPIHEESSYIFYLENGQPWGYILYPADWGENGFLFGQVAVMDFRTECYDAETGEQKDMRSCDPLMGDEVRRYGEVRQEEYRQLKSVLESIHFTGKGE